MKTCLLCKHFSIQTKENDLSEVTPGCDWSMECLKDNWQFDAYRDNEVVHRERMMTAETCPEYKHHSLP